MTVTERKGWVETLLAGVPEAFPRERSALKSFRRVGADVRQR